MKSGYFIAKSFYSSELCFNASFIASTFSGVGCFLGCFNSSTALGASYIGKPKSLFTSAIYCYLSNYLLLFFFFLCKLKEGKEEINLMYYASNCFILHFYGIILKLLLIKEAGTSPTKVWFPASTYQWINPCLSTRL